MFNMKMLRNIRLYVALLSFLILGSCKDGLDINTDPNNPIDVPVSQILPAAQVAIGYNLGTVTGGLSNAASTFVHQIVSFRVDQYNITGDYVNNVWFGLYANGLNNLEIIIRKGTAAGDFQYVGIAKIMKAYTFSIMVDLWGNIPYSEALQGNAIIAPRFDNDREIYESLFELIDEGIADLARGGGLVAGADDIIYGGDLGKWRRFAKTLKLKMYNQIRLERDVRAQVSALISEGDLLAATGEDFELPYGTSTQPPNRNPAFLAEYAGGSRESFVSEWFYNTMRAVNPVIPVPDSLDPRIPYYFYNQKANTTTEANAAVQIGRFITRRFGTEPGIGNANVTDLQTLHGLYPIGGRYDDGLGGPGRGTSGPGNVAQRLLPYFSRKFIEAELALTTGAPVAGGARTALQDGVRAAFAKVNQIAAATPSAVQTVPQIPAAEITKYTNKVLALYDRAATNERRLEIIITQKWIASYGFGIDSYTDYRRTGYPRLYQPNAADNTLSVNPFPLKFPYRVVDLVTNPNAPEQANVYTDRIFWDVN